MATPLLGMTEWAAAQASPWIVHNVANRTLEQGAGWFRSIDRDLATPPGSPAEGECYLVAGSATGPHVAQLEACRLASDPAVAPNRKAAFNLSAGQILATGSATGNSSTVRVDVHFAATHAAAPGKCLQVSRASVGITRCIPGRNGNGRASPASRFRAA